MWTQVLFLWYVRFPANGRKRKHEPTVASQPDKRDHLVDRAAQGVDLLPARGHSRTLIGCQVCLRYCEVNTLLWNRLNRTPPQTMCVCVFVQGKLQQRCDIINIQISGGRVSTVSHIDIQRQTKPEVTGPWKQEVKSCFWLWTQQCEACCGRAAPPICTLPSSRTYSCTISEDYRYRLTLAVPQQTVGDSVEPSGPRFFSRKNTGHRDRQVRRNSWTTVKERWRFELPLVDALCYFPIPK